MLLHKKINNNSIFCSYKHRSGDGLTCAGRLYTSVAAISLTGSCCTSRDLISSSLAEVGYCSVEYTARLIHQHQPTRPRGELRESTVYN